MFYNVCYSLIAALVLLPILPPIFKAWRKAAKEARAQRERERQEAEKAAAQARQKEEAERKQRERQAAAAEKKRQAEERKAARATSQAAARAEKEAHAARLLDLAERRRDALKEAAALERAARSTTPQPAPEAPQTAPAADPEMIFSKNSVTAGSKVFPAGYSITPTGAVVVFVDTGAPEKTRIRINPGQQGHAAARAAALEARKKEAPVISLKEFAALYAA